MTWLNVEDNALPGDKEIVEVQLENGSVQLACFMNGAWYAPSVERSMPDPNNVEIKTVVRWRPFTAVITAYQTKKKHMFNQSF